MSRTPSEPRYNHIAELTRGRALPLPEIPKPYLDFIAETFVQVFNELRDKYPDEVLQKDEAEVSALLKTNLNELGKSSPLWERLVSVVIRGSESYNYNGTSLEKRPDLSLYLTRSDLNFPLTVEAKIVDSKKSKTVSKYCKEGVLRFVDGQYAWARREAIMIAYVRDGSTINSALTPKLYHALQQSPPDYLVKTLPEPAGEDAMDLARTEHDRSFLYVGTPSLSNTPGPISLWHLWLT